MAAYKMNPAEKFNGKVVYYTPKTDIINKQTYNTTDFDPFNFTVQELASGNDSFQEGEEMKNEQEYTGILFEELKRDIREREERSRREISEREERFLKQMEQYSVDAVARENRYREEAKERELRYNKSMEEIKEIVRDGEKSRKSQTFAIWTLAVTTLIGIAAMVIAVIIGTN